MSVHLRRNLRSRSPESVFTFAEIATTARHPCSKTRRAPDPDLFGGFCPHLNFEGLSPEAQRIAELASQEASTPALSVAPKATMTAAMAGQVPDELVVRVADAIISAANDAAGHVRTPSRQD